MGLKQIFKLNPGIEIIVWEDKKSKEFCKMYYEGAKKITIKKEKDPRKFLYFLIRSCAYTNSERRAVIAFKYGCPDELPDF